MCVLIDAYLGLSESVRWNLSAICVYWHAADYRFEITGRTSLTEACFMV